MSYTSFLVWLAVLVIIGVHALHPVWPDQQASFSFSFSGSGSCQEDEACWRWSTMGNRKRGITTVRGTHVVVGPCRFRLMSTRGSIDRRLTPKLKGDRWARRNGCT